MYFVWRRELSIRISLPRKYSTLVEHVAVYMYLLDETLVHTLGTPTSFFDFGCQYPYAQRRKEPLLPDTIRQSIRPRPSDDQWKAFSTLWNVSHPYENPNPS